jgi:hypothetical protein
MQSARTAKSHKVAVYQLLGELVATAATLSGTGEQWARVHYNLAVTTSGLERVDDSVEHKVEALSIIRASDKSR